MLHVLSGFKVSLRKILIYRCRQEYWLYFCCYSYASGKNQRISLESVNQSSCAKDAFHLPVPIYCWKPEHIATKGSCFLLMALVKKTLTNQYACWVFLGQISQDFPIAFSFLYIKHPQPFLLDEVAKHPDTLADCYGIDFYPSFPTFPWSAFFCLLITKRMCNLRVSNISVSLY